MSEGVDVNKTVDLHDYIICHNCYFFKFTDRFQPKVCNGRNGFLQKAVSFNDVAIVSAKITYCRIHFWYLIQDEIVDLWKNADLAVKGRKLKIVYFYRV